MLAPLLARLFGAGGGLPGGLTPGQLGMAAIAVLFVLPRVLGIGVMPLLLIGGGGLFVFQNAKGGQGARGVLQGSRRVVQKVGEAVGKATGRPVSDAQAGLLLVAALFLLGRYFLASGSSGGRGGASSSFFGGGGADEPHAGYAAYSKGYRDGQKGKPFDPITDPTDSSASARSSSWGMGNMFSLLMVGSMLMRMAGQPPSVENLMMNMRRMGPMEMMIMFNVVSGLLF